VPTIYPRSCCLMVGTLRFAHPTARFPQSGHAAAGLSSAVGRMSASVIRRLEDRPIRPSLLLVELRQTSRGTARGDCHSLEP
jgi:hypothetical protein